jgi:hypothetical protein
VLLAASNYTGWYVGLTIAFLLIVVVVAIVATILTLALRIVEQAHQAIVGLQAVRENTSILPAIPSVNQTGLAILRAAQTARSVAGG